MTSSSDEFTSTHMTEQFVERLASAIDYIPSHFAGGIVDDALGSIMRSQLSVDRLASAAVVRCLESMQLVSEQNGVIGRSRIGDRLRREVRARGSAPLAVHIIRSGLMADQVRALRASLDTTAGGYSCGRAVAQRVAPQLIGLLARMDDVQVRGQITIGSASCAELDSVWNEVPPTSRLWWADQEAQRKAIGDRAELYSMQFERSAALGAWRQINWVSRDDDSLGYDIEVSGTTTRRIEVKGSTRPDVGFFLSVNEYRAAGRYGESYEIQYWGHINQLKDPPADYQRLLAAGYPVRIQNPVAALGSSPWTMQPSQYRVTGPGPVSAEP